MDLEALSVRLKLPDLWQQEAVRQLRSGHDVVLSAPTGAGKTFVFELLVQARALRGQAIFTVPTRALANDKWSEWKQAGWKVGIATGDRSVDTGAPVLVATLETQRERFLREGESPALLVVDEYQMIGHPRRGLHYELAVALAPPSTRLLLMSGSVANPGEIVDWLRDLGREACLVETKARPVPLDDVPAAALPYQPPPSIKGFWPRLAYAAIQSDCAPLLIFAPQRKAAEKIARQISEALPQSERFPLTQAQQHALGASLGRMVANRVAYHHSGLSYAQRAGIIEPLAKAGQLRVIVATTGLAAGINFSVRSVLISDTLYFDGPFERQIQPDELLQMFGRAGRRGLDEIGYVLSIDRSPRLADAHPRQLRRGNEVDWPTLLRVMKQAHEREESPFEAAALLCSRLFSRQTISLGFGGDHSVSPRAGPSRQTPLFDLGPTCKEWPTSQGGWAPVADFTPGEAALADVWVETPKKGWQPAIQTGFFLQEHVRKLGRLCRLDAAKTAGYGVEIALAQKAENGEWRLSRRWQKSLRAKGRASSGAVDELSGRLQAWLDARLPGVRVHRLEARQDRLDARLDIAGQKIAAHRDPQGKWLLLGEPRLVRVEVPTSYNDAATGQPLQPAPGSAAHAWRQLRLIDPDGNPTRRGEVFSFFHHGEGLAIAAALEDETYPVEELAMHVANLRAGFRFAEDQSERWPSERLGFVCRQTYGPVEYPGYLRLGLPEGYGDGAAEVVEARLAGRSSVKRSGPVLPAYGNGDVERATLEWLSLLRHISHAPSLEWPRWRAFQEAARQMLETHDRAGAWVASHLELQPHLLNREIRHRFTLKPSRS